MVTSVLEQTAETLATRLLPVGESAAIPWPTHPGWFIVLALAMPALTWLCLAWKRAVDADPNCLRRRGLRDLKRILGRAQRHNAHVPKPQHLRSWLRATAMTWNVRVAAPTAAQVATGLRFSIADNSWQALWEEAEEALYADGGAVSAEWITQASKAAAEVAPPPRQTWWPNRLSHWLPPLATAVLLGVGISIAAGPTGVSAEDAPATPGVDLEAVSSSARAALDSDWTDWAAHHDLAVTHLGQEEWHRALAHAAAAFLLNPGSTDIRQVLRFTLQQTQPQDPQLRQLLLGTSYQQFPARLSAAGWQRLALFAALVLSAGLIGLTTALYVKYAGLLPVAAGTAAFAAAMLLLSIICFQTYGTLARPNAGILLMPAEAVSVPTDLAPAKQVLPLAAGTVIETRRRFLGWQQVVMGDEPLRWVRRQAVLPFFLPASEQPLPPRRTW